MARIYTLEVLDENNVKVVITDINGSDETITKKSCVNAEAVALLTEHKANWINTQDDVNGKVTQLGDALEQINDTISTIESFIYSLS